MKLLDILIQETINGQFIWPKGADEVRQYPKDFAGRTAFIKNGGGLVKEMILPIADDASLFNKVSFLKYEQSLTMVKLGIPSIGASVQWNTGNEWITVTVLGVNGNEVWVKPEDGSESFVVNDDDFKPLPDERDLAVQQMFYDLPENMRPGKDVREAIYDAGYRKVKPLPDENQTIKQIADMIGKGSTALEDDDYIYRSIISGLINTPCRCDS